MLPVESSTILRLVIFSAFIGFVLFCASYATHVWLKRNKGNLSGGSWAFRAGAGLVVAGALGLAGSWALNRFVDRSGIVDGGGLFVVHARQDGHAVMTAKQTVEQGEVVATFHPPAFDDQIRVIDSRVAEARARIGTLRVRPLEIDGALLQRHEQLRVQQAQQLQFREEFDRARRELERGRIEATAQLERERGQILNDVAVMQTALAGVQQQLAVATGRLNRSGRLRRQGLTTVQAHDERMAAAVALNLERGRLETGAKGLAARLDLVAQQHQRAIAAFAAQAAELEGKAAATAQALAALGPALADAASRLEQDRTRAAARMASEIEVAQRQVETLLAERARVVASHQIVAPFAGRVVYRAGSPGLAPGGAAIMALSAGTGFVANIVMPEGEIESLAGAGRVMFALDHPVLKKYFPGEFRAVEPTSYEPGRMVATFDAQLPQDAIGLLGIGREAVKVRLLWQPPLLDSGHFRTSLAVLLLGVLLMFSDHLRGLLRLPFGGFDQRKA
jgi:hypothetical protein